MTQGTLDQWVVFGDPDDPPLRAGPGYDAPLFGWGRLTDSATPDATIVVVDAAANAAGLATTEPSTITLALWATVVYFGFTLTVR